MLITYRCSLEISLGVYAFVFRCCLCLGIFLFLLIFVSAAPWKRQTWVYTGYATMSYAPFNCQKDSVMTIHSLFTGTNVHFQSREKLWNLPLLFINARTLSPLHLWVQQTALRDTKRSVTVCEAFQYPL